MLCFVLLGAGCSGSGRQVVVYTSQDQVYAEPILKRFQEETGIRVRAVYDSEAVKTVGLANRLLAERQNPQCDVFWNNEELRTWQLSAQDVFESEIGRFGYRSRRIVINTNLLDEASAPKTLMELTNDVWRGKVALAYPLFGTTATHFLSLRQHWGAERWEEWCRNLAGNKSFLVDGNSVVVRLVGRGEAQVGLTDSDDIAAAQREGLPVRALPLGAENLLIANSVAVVANAPNPEEARALFEYLQTPAVVERLKEVNALEGGDLERRQGGTLKVDWTRLLEELEEGTKRLETIFLR